MSSRLKAKDEKLALIENVKAFGPRVVRQLLYTCTEGRAHQGNNRGHLYMLLLTHIFYCDSYDCVGGF